MLIKMTRTMIQTIADLPTSVSAAVLCVWLNMKCICRLDSAICMRSYRLTYHELLQSVECIGKLHINNNAQLAWANRRSIRSNYFAVYDDFSEDECEKFLRRSGHHIQTMYQLNQEDKIPIKVIAQFCHNLVSFHSILVTDSSGYGCLLLVNPNIVELSLYDNTSDPVSSVALPNLEYLCLSGAAFDDDTCSTLLKAASRLRYLSISSRSVTSAGMIEAARFCPQVQFFRLPNLNDIDLTLQTMISSLSVLHHISLIHCESLTDEGIRAVAQSVQALHSIHLTYSPRITNVSLLVLAQYHHRTLKIVMVEERPLSYRPRNANDEDIRTFNGEAVASFREKCTMLQEFEWRRSFEMFNCYNERMRSHLVSADRVTMLVFTFLTDEVLHAIAQHCTQLKVLKLFDFVPINLDACADTAIREVLDRCSHLTTIMPRNPFHRERFKNLAAAYPKVTIPDHVAYLSPYEFDSIYRSEYEM